MDNYISILGNALADTSITVITFLPHVIVAILMFTAGWVAGVVVGKSITHIVNMLRVDQALHRAGMDIISERAGFRVTVAGFLGATVKWLVIVSFTVAATNILGLNQVTDLLSGILKFIPQVIIASIVLVMAALVADFVARIVLHSVKATGIDAQFAATVARWSILIVGGIFPALTQLGIAQGLVEVLFTGLVFAFSLAFGLAFGLGGRDSASRMLERMRQ